MASILGTRVQRVEDPRFLTVGGTYSDDLRDPRLAGALHVTFVRSTMAHARLSSVDVSAARSAPGVVAVLTAADLGLEPKLSMRMFNKAMTRSPLADGVVRFVGELIAAILTEERYQGADAAELVEIDYDPLPVVVDPLEAAEDRVLLFPEAGTNVSNAIPAELDDHLFDGCEVTVTQTILNRRLAIAPLEPRACAAVPGDDGRLLAWLSSQGAQGSRDAILTALGLEAGQLHVLTPDVGGGFGGKSSAVAAAEDIVVCRAARVLGRPVRWVESRTDNVSTMHGRGQVQTVTMGGTRDGRIEAYRLSVLGEAGAYPTIGALLPMMTRMMAPGVYDIAKVEVETKSVVTNTAPTVAYRGAGRPEACAAIERAVDLFAAEIGMDPVEVRRRNMVAAFAEPHTTPMGTTYDVGDYPASLALVLEAADYDELRAEQARRRAAGDRRQLGIGLAAYVEVTGFGGSEVAKIEVKPDGGAVVYTGTSPHGQGHHTSWAMIASDRLGIPIDKIEFVYGDTDLVPVGGGTGGSRSLQLGGSAVHETAGLVIEEAKQRAAKQLEANPDDIILDVESGRFHVAGSPTAARSWSEVAGDDGLAVDASFKAAAGTFPFGAHVAVVEVDTETGQVTLERFIAVDDAGTMINPLIVEGQRHGGIAQGAAQALCEEFIYDADGNPLTSNLADFTFISTCELPSFELVPMETPTPMNPLGAKGIGESGTIGATPAVQNAVVDAVAHLGVRHIDIPCTPERVWTAIQEASK